MSDGFLDLIDEASDFKGCSDYELLELAELKNVTRLSCELINFLNDKLYTDQNYNNYKNNDAKDMKQTDKDRFRRAVSIARRYTESYQLPKIITQDIFYGCAQYACQLEDRMDAYGIESGLFTGSQRHFDEFKVYLDKRRGKFNQPKLWSITIEADGDKIADSEYIVSITPEEALSKVENHLKRIGAETKRVNIEIVKMTDVTA